MKVLELEIYNLRGIRHLLLKPDGGNFVVYGPNGSGKSAVVDAIDFLLTGRILRLTGKGTRGITLSKYGPHVDHEPREATVRAIVQLPGLENPVEIKRCLSNPFTLECDESLRKHLESIMILARRGQHVLTRREILKYITAEASTRAQKIQELLNITEIEDIRKALVNVQNNLRGSYQAANSAVGRAKGAINATVSEENFHEGHILQVVNQKRIVLNGEPISILRSTNLKTGLIPPIVVSIDKNVNVTLLEQDIQILREVILDKNQATIAKSDKQLRTLTATIRSDPQLLRALSRLQLTELGITLIDETGSCPLCDTQWPPGKLHEYLEQRLSTAQVAAQHQERITKLSDSIVSSVNTTIASIHTVIKAAQDVDLKDELPPLQSWLGNMDGLSNALSDVVEKYPDPRFDINQVQRMLAPDNVVEILGRIHLAYKAKYPEATPEQIAWDTLTRLEENLKALEKAQKELKAAKMSYKRATIFLESFQKARDTVLGSLYEAIRDRFVELYRQLHGPDERDFTASIAPERAGLNLEVDFYKRGIHPPHALHSEGHQDSMGICLFLALAEHLTEGLIDLFIFDDVVMSVDNGHRRDVCHLLATSFPHRQFIITTHDKTWANQLKSEGVVSSRGIVEFYNWNIETGPKVNYEIDMWERIEEDLQKNNIPSAAARLRRGLEQFFGMASDALQVPVKYKLDGRWELGDFLLPAMDYYRELLKKARKAASSWDDRERQL